MGSSAAARLDGAEGRQHPGAMPPPSPKLSKGLWRGQKGPRDHEHVLGGWAGAALQLLPPLVPIAQVSTSPAPGHHALVTPNLEHPAPSVYGPQGRGKHARRPCRCYLPSHRNPQAPGPPKVKAPGWPMPAPPAGRIPGVCPGPSGAVWHQAAGRQGSTWDGKCHREDLKYLCGFCMA